MLEADVFTFQNFLKQVGYQRKKIAIAKKEEKKEKKKKISMENFCSKQWCLNISRNMCANYKLPSQILEIATIHTHPDTSKRNFLAQNYHHP